MDEGSQNGTLVNGSHVERRVLRRGDLVEIGGVKIFFEDGHRSGLFDWQYIYKLGRAWQPLWQDYLSRLRDAGRERSGPDPFEEIRARGENPSVLP